MTQTAQEKQMGQTEPENTRTYFTAITADRLKKAEQRLAQRQHDNAVRLDIEVIKRKTGLLSFSTTLHVGDKGIYRGIARIAGKHYGVIEQANRHAKLMPADQLDSKNKGKTMVIEQHTDYQGRERLRGVQPDVRQRQRSQGRGSLGIGER